MATAYMALVEAGKVSFREFDVVPPVYTLYVAATPDLAIENLLARQRARIRLAVRQVQSLQNEHRIVLRSLRDHENQALLAVALDADAAGE